MMNPSLHPNHSMVGYEYKSVTVRKDLESLWRDGYAQFGWKLEKSGPATQKHVWGPFRLLLAPLALIPFSPVGQWIEDHPSPTKAELKFKRNRAIAKKAELNQLQFRFEEGVAQIERLEKNKQISAAAIAYLIGFTGTLFMGVSVFSYLADMQQLSILMAIPGFSGWILSFFAYQNVKSSKSRKATPLIERQYDSIYETCRKASDILPGKTL